MKRYFWMFKYAWKHTLRFLLRPYYLIRTSWPVWFYILNREGRNLYQKDTNRLIDLQKRITEDLQKNGVALTHLDELFPGQNLLPKLRQYAQALEKGAQIKKGKTYLRLLWETKPFLEMENPFVRLALDQKVLEIANAYLGMYSKFRHCFLAVTMPMGGESNAVKSQRWHRDPEDKKMCKMFVYLNDVDEESGPFIYVPKSNYPNRWSKVFPQKPPVGYYPPDGAVEKIIPKEAIRVLTGGAGTVLFGDTGGLHKGGYATAKERTMMTATYTAKSSLWPTYYNYPENFKDEFKKMNVVQQYAVQR